MTMYAGTGEGYFNSDMITGRGVLKSQDGGVTWASLPNSQSMTNVNRLVVSPTESNVILAACTYGGIFRSTNSGTNWTKVFNAQAGQTVVFHPTDGSKAVASVLDYDFTRSTWFHRPIYTTDGGINWTAAAWNDNEGRSLDGFSPRLELAYSKSQPNNVFAYCGYYGKVYKSTNGGQTFNSVTTTTTTNGQAWYDTSIWVDPVNENWMVVTGVHPFRSIDGGATFTQISRGYIMTDDPHPDVHFGVADPGYNGTTNNRFYLTTDGGAFVTNNVWTAGIGSGWSMLTRTARSSQFYGAIGDEATGRIIGGMQDNGTIQQDFDSRDASLFFGGDGGWCALDPTNSNYMYGEYVYLKLFRSTDGGNTVQYIRNGLTDSDDSRNRANFIAPFVLDDSNPNRMYAGGASLWRTTNLKGTSPSWTAIKPEFPTSGYSPISAVAVSPSDPNVVWVGHNNGAVFRTGNALATTPTWTVVDDNGTTNPLPNRYVGRILIDSTNPAKVWVAHGGFANDNLRVTTDGGATWALATGSGTSVLPSAPIRALAHQPSCRWPSCLGRGRRR
jgi:photosystem II stability/assembly factor-like uncharacterized protein